MRLGKAEIIKLLQENKDVKIKFIKVDGTVRDMVATINEEVAKPQSDSVEPVATTIRKSKPAGVQTVWDVDANGWRSFKWENLREVNGVPYPHGVIS